MMLGGAHPIHTTSAYRLILGVGGGPVRRGLFLSTPGAPPQNPRAKQRIRGMCFVMRYLNPDSARRNVHLSSPAPGSVTPGYHKMLEPVKGSRATAPSSPHYARTTSRDRMARGRVICSTKASRQGVIASLIMEREAGPFGEVVEESPWGLPFGEGR